MDPDSSDVDMMGVFPIAYVNLSGESMNMTSQVVVPAFPRRSLLIDAVLGVDSRAGSGPPSPGSLHADSEPAASVQPLGAPGRPVPLEELS